MRTIGLFNFTRKNAVKIVTAAKRKMFDGYFSQQIMIPPTMNTSDFLRSYGEIGWLFACVNRISQNIGSAEWKPYKGEKVQQNSLAMNVLKKPNRFMSQFQLFWKTAAYLELTGKCFWYIAKDKLGRPKEIWCLNPLDIWVVPDKDNFIKGYLYKAGAVQIPLDIDEVIFFNLPDLMNPYSGKGPAQAAANDLESEKYTSTYVRNFFYNDATPAGIVNFPDIGEDDYDRAKEQWNDKYKGVDKSHSIAFTRGGAVTFTPITMNIKDMDVSALKDKSRDGILGTFGVPLSILGIMVDANRANAETAEYTFAKHTIKPLLQLFQDVINNEFVPMFGEESELRFTDPVPENKEFILSVLNAQVNKTITPNAGIEILNKLMGWTLKPIEGGDLIYQPVSMQPLGTALPMIQAPAKPEEDIPPDEPTKSFKKKLFSKAVRKRIAWHVNKNNETRHEQFLKMAAPLKKEFNKVIQSYLKDMQKEVVQKVLDGSKDPVDLKKWNKTLQDKTIALYIKCYKTGGQAVVNEFKSIENSVHKAIGVEFDIKDPKVQAKIQNKVSKITQVNKDTKQRIKDVIDQAYKESDEENQAFTIKSIAEKIGSEDFSQFSEARCNTISQTEVLGSLNQATNESYKQNSDLIDGKYWLATYDNTRESHLQAGEDYSEDNAIGVDELFQVGDGEGECPLDDSLPVEEVVNCHCCMAPKVNV